MQNNMKKTPILAGLLITFFIGLIVLISYFHWWLIVITFFFILMALVLMAANAYGLWRLTRLNSNEDDIGTLALLKLPLMAKKGFLNRAKFLLFSTLMLIDNSVCWPFMVYGNWRNAREKQRDNMSLVASTIMNPQQYSKSIYYLFMSLLLALLYYAHWIGTGYAKVATIVLLSGAMSLLISFLVGPIGLADTFRRSPRNIYKAVLIMSLCMTLALTVYFMLLVSAYTYHAFNFTSLNIVFSEFYKHETIGLIWNRKFSEIRPLSLFVDLSGLIFAATVLATAKNYSKDFKRNNEDIKVIVATYILRKEYDAALKWLNKASKGTWDSALRSYFTIIQAGLGNQAKVLDSFKHIEIEAAETNYISDHKYLEVINNLRVYKIDESFIIAFLYKWLEDGQCEGFLFAFMANEYYMGENSFLLQAAHKLFTEDAKWKDRWPLVDFIISNTSEDRANIYEALYQVRDQVETLQYDPFTICVVDLSVISACMIRGMEEDHINDRLEKFAARLETVKGPRDLMVPAVHIAGMLITLPREFPYYDRLVEIYERLKEIMIQGDCQHIVEQFKILRQEEE